MKFHFLKIILFLFSISLVGCKQNESSKAGSKTAIPQNEIHYAKGLSIFKFPGFSIVKVTNPWPNANKEYTYILQEKNGIIPDSLKQFTTIQIPIKSIVVTSTTHIPSLEMLGVENTLVGFPQLDYISSVKVRNQIDAGKIKELGQNQDLNTEVIIDLAPSVIIGYGIDNNNPTLDNLQKSGLKILLNGDWNEQTPLGKAEWIKLFGALYGLDKKAENLFTAIEKEYQKTAQLALKAKTKPTVLMGAMYENQWFVPKGDSWGCYFIKEAQADYLWSDSKGTGGLSLSFETVLEKAKSADFWIGPGEFSSLKEMTASNIHYKQFEAFQNKKVYSYSLKKGKKGGLIYFELAPNRPDLVLKDMLKIVHPELLPDYKLFFFEQLK
jgi:iron complex transport system substrate-binding protein